MHIACVRTRLVTLAAEPVDFDRAREAVLYECAMPIGEIGPLRVRSVEGARGAGSRFLDIGTSPVVAFQVTRSMRGLAPVA